MLTDQIFKYHTDTSTHDFNSLGDFKYGRFDQFKDLFATVTHTCCLNLHAFASTNDISESKRLYYTVEWYTMNF